MGLPPTTSKDSSDSTPVTTFSFQFPNFTGTHTGVTFALGTNSVPGGGTGDTSFTAYAPVIGGTTATGALRSAASGISNSGYVLTSTGATSAPTWQPGNVTGVVAVANGGTGASTVSGALANLYPAWTAYTPSFAPSSGAFGSASAVGRYYQSGKVVFFSVVLTITTIGTASGIITFGLPATANGASIFCGRENSATGKMLQANASSGANVADVFFYDNSFPGGSGYSLILSGSYESQ